MNKRICSMCGGEFIGAYHARYCSNACKQRAYRERKKKKRNEEPANGNKSAKTKSVTV